jgi:hypothetical protein
MGRAAPRALVAVYAFFALAAGARGVVQTVLAPGTAVAAHGLTVLAALIYLVAALALHRSTELSLRAATLALGLELVGVLAVGAATVAAPDLLGADTVWSGFGAAYGWIPLALPLVGLVTIRRIRRRSEQPEPAAGTCRAA